jgi:hypothetical protein
LSLLPILNLNLHISTPHLSWYWLNYQTFRLKYCCMCNVKQRVNYIKLWLFPIQNLANANGPIYDHVCLTHKLSAAGDTKNRLPPLAWITKNSIESSKLRNVCQMTRNAVECVSVVRQIVIYRSCRLYIVHFHETSKRYFVITFRSVALEEKSILFKSNWNRKPDCQEEKDHWLFCIKPLQVLFQRRPNWHR